MAKLDRYCPNTSYDTGYLIGFDCIDIGSLAKQDTRKLSGGCLQCPKNKAQLNLLLPSK